MERGARRGRRADHRGQGRRRRRLDRRARRRPWHQRGRLRLGPPRPRRHRHAARLRPAGRRRCQLDLLGFDRATIDEAANAATIVLLGPDLKEELPVLYLRLRDAAAEAAQPHHRVRARSAAGSPAYAWRTIDYEPGGVSRRRWPRALADPDDRRPARQGQRGHRRRPGQPRRDPRDGRQRRRRRTLLAAVPGAKVLPAFRRGNVVGALEWACVPATGGIDTRWRSPRPRPTARSSAWSCSVPTRSPTSPTPTSPGGRWPAPAGSSPSTRSSPTSTQPADVVLAAAAYGEKSGTTTNLEGRVTHASPSRSRPRGTSRPDWMIAAELAELLGGDLGVSSVDDVTDAIAANVAGFGEATVAALRSARDGVVCTGSLPPATAVDRSTHRRAQQLRLPPRGQPQAVRPGRRHRQVAVARAPGRWAPQLHLHPLDLERVGATDGADVKVTSKRASMVLTLVADDVGACAASAWVPFNQPGANIGELIDCVRRRHRRADRDPLMLALDSARSTIIDAAAPTSCIVLLKVRRHLRHRPRRARCSWCGSSARSIAGMQNRIGPNKAGPFGILQTLADGIKLFFKEDLLPDTGRPLRVQAGPVPRVRAGVPGVVRHPARRRLQRRQGRHGRRGSATSPSCSWPTRRSASCCCSRCSSIAVYGIMLAGWAVGLEVPAARLGAGVGADGQLRGGARPQPGRGAPASPAR